MAAVIKWALGGCVIYAARCRQTYRHRGTVLGVFTPIVLMRPTVVDLFNGKQLAPHPLPPDY